jgi:prolyl 4-hydroxylase
MFRFLSSSLLLACLAVQCQSVEDSYGVDCSWPVHSKEFKCGDLLGDRQKAYNDFMDGCRKQYGTKGNRCDSVEDDRLNMSLRQPQSMVNYTSVGFKKIKAPKEVMNLLTKHWEKNKEHKKAEVWTAGNVYVNHWDSPTYMVVSAHFCNTSKHCLVVSVSHSTVDSRYD